MQDKSKLKVLAACSSCTGLFRQGKSRGGRAGLLARGGARGCCSWVGSTYAGGCHRRRGPISWFEERTASSCTRKSIVQNSRAPRLGRYRRCYHRRLRRINPRRWSGWLRSGWRRGRWSSVGSHHGGIERPAPRCRPYRRGGTRWWTIWWCWCQSI